MREVELRSTNLKSALQLYDSRVQQLACTDMRRLTTAIRYEKCVVRRCRLCAKYSEAYYKP
jgi:hypothetical protein